MKQKIKNLLQQGQFKKAEKLCRTLLKGTGKTDSEAWTLAANIYTRLGDFPKAQKSCVHAIKIAPKNFEAQFLLAMAEHSQNNIQSAITGYHKTIEILPSHTGAHANLGMLLPTLGKYKDAVTHLETALKSHPKDPGLLHCIGNVYSNLGEPVKAEQTLQTAAESSQDNMQIQHDLGRQLLANGKSKEAVQHFNKVIKTDKNSFSAYSNLSIAFYNLNQPDAALLSCCHALKIKPQDIASRQRFVQLFNSTPDESVPEEAWGELKKTFQHKGIDSSLLVLRSIKHIKENKIYKSIKDSSITLKPEKFSESLLSNEYLSFLNDKLVMAMLSNALILDLDIERLIISLRKAFLHIAYNAEDSISTKDHAIHVCFISAIANQCFLNEYIYHVSDEEKNTFDQLLNKIVQNHEVNTSNQKSIYKLAILGCYQKLERDIHNTLKTKTTSTFPPCVQEVIKRQIIEPETEKQLSNNITSLTGIDDEISKLVQEQYEESPYPRWMNATLNEPQPYLSLLKKRMPYADLPERGKDKPDMLIAGSGTGRHVVQSAAAFKDTNITAIDLSKASLSYAKRKADEYGLDNINFYQADILHLNKLNQSFHIIESVGVLHHLNEPADGLKILTGLLENNGFFHIGLYSTYARRDIDAARELLLSSGFKAKLEDMNEARNTIERLPDDDARKKIIYANDFYSTSGFRDLIFHVNEHTYTLLEIKELIEHAGLKFLGFEFRNNSFLSKYKKLYPDDKSCSNLENWHEFEKTHEDTFLGMYMFWCQKQVILE